MCFGKEGPLELAGAYLPESDSEGSPSEEGNSFLVTISDKLSSLLQTFFWGEGGTNKSHPPALKDRMLGPSGIAFLDCH